MLAKFQDDINRTAVEGPKGQPMFDAANFRRRVLRIAAAGDARKPMAQCSVADPLYPT
jgi:hypothetical protein